MAHYAEINKDNIVVNIIAGKDENLGVDWEEYYTRTMGIENGTRFLRTSYNTSSGMHKTGGIPFRKNYASIGGIYDPVRDAFYTQKPYESWVLDEDTCRWLPPVPLPIDFLDENKMERYFWDEQSKSWKQV